ncbi:hypothetical protein CEXT_484381 [Caerostris extrusa]|uniref:Uncharacterized protein n=1 Tax=Caerostris extrusa TaxID=172846 RepID=A0AAV4Y458_CAEEX|nr:hypothetical protein CEXT_484381 [Caerostris extrusa]
MKETPQKIFIRNGLRTVISKTLFQPLNFFPVKLYVGIVIAEISQSVKRHQCLLLRILHIPTKIWRSTYGCTDEKGLSSAPF